MERVRMSQEQIAEAINKLKRNGILDNQVLELVKTDYQYGLITEEIELYLDRKFEFGQKLMISKALREHGADLAKAIAREDMDEQAMAIAIEYYGQGVPVETIVESMEEQYSAYSLRQIYKEVLAEIRETEAEINEEEEEDEAGVDREFVQQMLGEMKAIALTIKQDSKRYDALSDKLQEISVSKKAEAELEKQKADTERLQTEVERLQGEIATLNIANANLRKMLDDKEGEIEKLKNTKEQMKTQIPYMSGDLMYPQGNIGYQQGVPIMEKTKPKKNGLANLFGKSDTKKTGKQDITKLVASGQLNTEQLMQVKVAISRGLTDEQLCDLIQGNVSAEQMKEIIEIAVLENSMR